MVAPSHFYAHDSTLRFHIGAKLDEISRVAHFRVCFKLITRS